MKSDISVVNIFTTDRVSIDVLEFSGTYISIDNIPKYKFFGEATKSSVKFNIKTNILTIKYKQRRCLHHYELDLNSDEMKRIGV